MTSSANRPNRRTFLRGAAASIALPYLPSLGAVGCQRAKQERVGRHAQAASINGALIVITTPNGVSQPAFSPTGMGKEFELPESWTPLLDRKAELTVFRNLTMPAVAQEAACSHRQALGVWTGGPRTEAWDAEGPSIDTLINDRVTKSDGSSLDVLRLGVQTPGDIGVGAASYGMDGRAQRWQNNARQVFQSLFGAAPGGTPEAPLAASVLDDVMSDYRRVAARVSGEDRRRLEAHLEAIRAAEVRAGMLPATCASLPDESAWPTHGGGYDSYSDPALTLSLFKSMYELAGLAVACQQTRVVSIMVLQEGEGGSTSNYPWLDAKLANFHEASHRQGPELKLPDRFHLQQVAALANQLSELGSLQNTLILHGSGIANGARHDHVDLPIFLLGGLGGALQTGQLVDAAGRAPNDLCLTLLRAFGFDDAGFGRPERCTGPFTEMLPA